MAKYYITNFHPSELHLYKKVLREYPEDSFYDPYPMPIELNDYMYDHDGALKRGFYSFGVYKKELIKEVFNAIIDKR